MRIAIFLLLVGFLQTQATDSYSQNTKLSISVSNTELVKVLDKIENQSEFYFLYNEKLIDATRKVSIEAKEERIEDVLKKLFSGTDVEYSIIDRKIILAPAYLSESQQTGKKISGKVTDLSGASLPGASVIVKGTTVGVITDNSGNYSLSNVPENATLQFSFVGMKMQEIIVGSKTAISIALVEDAIGIEEVVAIGYGTQKKVNVIGSVTTVTNKELNVAPVSMVSNALAGRVPGAIVQQNNGEPGHDASTILIRGKATLGNNSPLIVVDGIPGRDMNSLSPTDIESITVLKDASAAIYGARAANGVILITTKRGTEGTPTFTYGFSQGVQSPTKIPEMCDASTYAEMIREMQTYRNVSESNMTFSLDDIEKYKSGKYPWTHPNTDWYAEVLKGNSTTRNHNFSVSGGTKAVTYYGSFGSQLDDGIYKNSATSYKRYNMSIAIDAKINKFLKVGIETAGSQENGMHGIEGRGSIWWVTRRSRPTDVAFYPNGLPGIGIDRSDNPVVVSGFAPGFDDAKTYRLNTKFSATFIVPGVSGLTLSGYYAYDKYFNVEKKFEKLYKLYSLDKATYLNAGNTGTEDGSAFIGEISAAEIPDPRLNNYSRNSDNKVFNLKANYDKTFSGVHNISAFISMESSDYLYNQISAFRRYFISDKLPYLFAGGNTAMSNGESVSLDSRLNYFGRVMYNFKETYLLQFALRRDGSLRFSKENGRWGTFPSVLAGWRVSNESFWKDNVKFIDYFKLKASFGQMGNDQVNAFQYLTNYAFGTGMILGSNVYSSSLVQSGNPNPFITWEVANIFNTGFESAFLNNKMTFNADFFYQRRSNILVKRDASVPTYTGITLPDENFGIVDNKGLELELGYNESKGDFSYGINGNIAYARNKIIEFDEPARNVAWQVRTGHPQGALLLYKSTGIFRDQEQVDALPHVSGARPGDIIIEDYDKNGIISSNDMILFDKTADPELTYGLSFNLSYKNLDLRALIQGTGTTMRYVGNELKGSVGNYFAYEGVDRWTVDNIDATRPRAYERAEEYWVTQYPSDYWYVKGGYARMKNIELSYSIPKRLLNVIMLKDAKVYFSGQNLFLIYSQNKVLDPESGSMDLYPIMKIYNLGVKVAF